MYYGFEANGNREVATFYSGIGGCDWGLEQAGYNVVFGVEYDPKIAIYYQLNHPQSTLFNCKVSDRDYSDYKGLFGVHGSPPCQSFSSNRNPNLPLRSDHEESYNFVKAISQIKPVFVTLENVQRYANSAVFMTVCMDMWDLGYYAIFSEDSLKAPIYNYLNFGGCQRRHRLIMRWIRSDKLDIIPHEFVYNPVNKLGIGYIYAPKLEPDYSEPSRWIDVISHDWELKPGTVKPYQYEQMDLTKIEPESYYLLDKINVRGYKKHGIVGADDPVWTITTGSQAAIIFTSEDPIEYDVKPRNFAEMQGFPKDCILDKNVHFAKYMIGNAVPPEIIKRIWSKFIP
jgi:site-specific DNA-cytosine methylase